MKFFYAIKIDVEDADDIDDTFKKFQELIKRNIILQDFYNQFSSKPLKIKKIDKK